MTSSTSSAAEEDDRVCRQVYGMQQEEPLFEGGFLKEFVDRGLNRHADDLCPAGCQSNDVCMMGFTVEACKVFGNRHLYNRVWYRRKMFHFAKADREAQIVAGIIEAVKKPEGGPPGRFMCRDFSQGGHVFREAPLVLAQAHVRLAFRLANSTRMTYAPRRRQDEEKKKTAPSADLASAKHSQKGKSESIATTLDRMEFTPTNTSTSTTTRKKKKKTARLSTKREEPDATRMCGTVGWYDTDIAMTALSNYETFYNMPLGTADLSVVEATSAGVEGWAFCCLDVDNMVPPSSSTKDIPDVSKPAAKPAAACKKPRAKKKTTTTRPSVGEQEEKRQLQLVLLESIGVRNPYTNLSNNETEQEDTEDDDDNNSQDNDNTSASSYSYEYDTEEEEEEEEEGGDQASNLKDVQEEEEAGSSQVVSSVILEHHQATAQDDNHSVPDNEEEEEDADEEGTTTSGSFLHVSDMGSLYSRDDSWQDSEDERDFAALQELIENQRL